MSKKVTYIEQLAEDRLNLPNTKLSEFCLRHVETYQSICQNFAQIFYSIKLADNILISSRKLKKITQIAPNLEPIFGFRKSHFNL
jgi:hypothetical protein